MHAPSRILLKLIAALTSIAALTVAPLVQAGPTVSADLDLGTSLKTAPPPGAQGDFGPEQSPLYLAGFTVRAGWRFDLGPIFLLPEVAGGYAVERFTPTDTVPNVSNLSLARLLGGLRAGWSLPLAPAVRFEPAIFGHGGYARYTKSGQNGVAADVGLSLDLRLFRYFIVGAQVGYDVVTSWYTPYGEVIGPPPPNCVQIPTGCVPVPAAMPVTVTTADKWIGYGLHAGVVFW